MVAFSGYSDPFAVANPYQTPSGIGDLTGAMGGYPAAGLGPGFETPISIGGLPSTASYAPEKSNTGLAWVDALIDKQNAAKGIPAQPGRGQQSGTGWVGLPPAQPFGGGGGGGGGSSGGGGTGSVSASTGQSSSRSWQERYPGIQGIIGSKEAERNKFYQQMLGTIGEYTGQRAADIGQTYKEQGANISQNLAKLGMANTTVAPSLAQGNVRERESALNRLTDQMLGQKLGVMGQFAPDSQLIQQLYQNLTVPLSQSTSSSTNQSVSGSNLGFGTPNFSAILNQL